jgi:hypothetical protein
MILNVRSIDISPDSDEHFRYLLSLMTLALFLILHRAFFEPFAVLHLCLIHAPVNRCGSINFCTRLWMGLSDIRNI